MNIRSARKSKRARSFAGLPIFQLISLSLLSLIAPTEGEDHLSTASKHSSSLRPEETLLQVFAKSFDPEDGTVSPDCQRDSHIYRAALLKYKPWALKMYDSSTKIGFGVITGNFKQLGNYDECLRVQSDNGFVGKACSAKVQFLIASKDDDEPDDDEPDMRDLLVNAASASGLKNWTSGLSDPYEWLWCVPSSCSARDVAEVIEVALEPLKRSPKVEFTVTVGNDSCHTEESDRAVFEVADWLYISLLVLFGVIIVASTAYDMVDRRNPANPDRKDTKHNIFTSFSLYTNGKSLLNVRRSADSIDCLDGIRFLSICWIIYGHSANLEIEGVLINRSDITAMYERWDTLIFLNFNISTDTFFLLSGTLLAYSEMGRKEKDPEGYKFSIWKLYIHRYLRLTPSYAMMIGFYATLLHKMGSGPHWNGFVGVSSYYCVKNWWSNLLYVNNYVHFASVCMPQAWYLAADMQMIWLSPIFLYPMLGNGKRKQKIFLALLATAFVASILTPFLITYCQRLSGTMLYYRNSQKELADVFIQVYMRVYTRWGTFLVGLGLGYFLRWTKLRKTLMGTSLVIGGWTIAIAAGLAVLFGPRQFYFPDHEYNVVEAMFYAGFHRPVYALAVGWIVIASVFGYAGPVGTLLSWNVWAPFSKLTYSAYLSHYAILQYNAGSSRSPTSYTTFGAVHTFFGNLVLTLFMSVILCFCFEAPFCRLGQLLISRGGHNPTSGPFKKKESIPEIYRPTGISFTISGTYNDFMDRSANVRMGNRWQPQSSSEANNSFAPSRSSSIDLKMHHVSTDFKVAGASGFKDDDAMTGVDNLGFEKTS